MKKLLLIAGAICFAGALKAQVVFAPFFSQDFQSSSNVNDYMVTTNNSSAMGTFYPVAVTATTASIAIATETTNNLFKLTKPTTSVSTDNNKYLLIRNFDFGATPPKRIKLNYKIRIVGTTATQASNAILANNIIQLGPLNPTSTSYGAAGNIYNLNYSSRNVATAGTATYYLTTSGDASTAGAAVYSEYVCFVNNGFGAAYTYTDPLGGITETVGDNKVDVWVKVGAAAFVKYIDEGALTTTSVSFGSFKVSQNANSWNTTATPNYSYSNEIYLDDLTISTADASVLPISLTSLTGKSVGKSVQINWATASETNNDRYEIQRSNDGKNFNTIGNLKGAGTSPSANAYTFTDENPGAGTNYYRLKQYDFDGTIGTSEVIAVKSNIAESSISVSSNGSQTNVQIISANATSSKLELYDINGRKLAEQGVSLNKGFNKIALDKSLTAGIYFVKLIDGAKVITQKFAVQ